MDIWGILNLIALFICLVSGGFLFAFIFKKLPYITAVEGDLSLKPKIKEAIKEQAQKLNPLQNLNFIAFLENSLLKTRTFILKSEGHVTSMIKTVRERYREETTNTIFSADYWDHVKDMTVKKSATRKKIDVQIAPANTIEKTSKSQTSKTFKV